MPDPVLLDVPKELATQRLLLRAPRTGDGPALFDAVQASLPELRRFLASLPWVAGAQSAELSEVYCRNAESNVIARRDLPFLLWERATGSVVGAAGLHRIDWHTPKAEVGYWCRSASTGQGYIAEAVEALCELAFRQLAVVRVELVTDEANGASRRVAARCGFDLEGVLRSERRAPDGTLRNTCIYARLAPRS